MLWVIVAPGLGVTSGIRAQETTVKVPLLIQIGSENGAVEEAFAFIGDLEVTGSGDLLILDRFAPQIAWFGADGKFREAIGRSGSGPGEFRVPYRMTLDDRGRLHVLDSQLRRISVYVLSDSGAVHVSDQRVAGNVSDLCAIGARRFLLMPYTEMLIHELDADGREVRAFGTLEEPDRALARRMADVLPLIRGFYNQSIVTCDATRGMIVVLHENIPVVQGFALDGRLVWRTVLEDFQGQEIYRPERGVGFGARSDPRTGVAHSGSEVAVGANGRIVVTLWKGGRGDREGKIEARVLDSATGKEVGRTLPAARLMKVANGRSYGYLRYPYSRAVVY